MLVGVTALYLLFVTYVESVDTLLHHVSTRSMLKC